MRPSSTAAAPTFSSSRDNFVVPGIGTIHGCCASNQARAPMSRKRVESSREVFRMLIRNESESDWAAISDVNRRAFNAEGEPQLVEALRAAGKLTLSLVAPLWFQDCGRLGYRQ